MKEKENLVTIKVRKKSLSQEHVSFIFFAFRCVRCTKKKLGNWNARFGSLFVIISLWKAKGQSTNLDVISYFEQLVDISCGRSVRIGARERCSICLLFYFQNQYERDEKNNQMQRQTTTTNWRNRTQRLKSIFVSILISQASSRTKRKCIKIIKKSIPILEMPNGEWSNGFFYFIFDWFGRFNRSRHKLTWT